MHVCMDGRTEGRIRCDVIPLVCCSDNRSEHCIGKPVFVSFLKETKVASLGNDGDKTTHFNTNRGNNA